MRPPLRRESLGGGWAAKRSAGMIVSQGQAKQFFVAKIVAQAAHEGHPLSDNERWMLSFSESDPQFVVDPARVAALEAEIPDLEYEAKVAGLVKRACAADVASNPNSLAEYKEAFAVLKEGDHYLMIMLKQGLAKWLRPWWALFW
jgi:hypothetical protein